MWAGTGGEATAGSCPGSGLRPARRSAPSPAECVTACPDTAAGRGTCRSSARAKPGCCCCWACWRLTSPGGGHRPAPRSSSSWWTGGPCLCCCRGGGGQQGGGESRTTNKRSICVWITCFLLKGSTLIHPPFISMQAVQQNFIHQVQQNLTVWHTHTPKLLYSSQMYSLFNFSSSLMTINLHCSVCCWMCW